MDRDMPLDTNIDDAFRKAEDEYDSDIYFYRGWIDGRGHSQVVAETGRPSRKKAILIIETDGGELSSAFRIARLFQAKYECFSIYVPRRCAGAGTLLALGSHELILDRDSELGPIEPQRRKHPETSLQEPVQASRSALNALGELALEIFDGTVMNLTTRSKGAVSFSEASEVGVALTGAVMSGLTSRLEPVRFGTQKLGLDCAIEYGKRLIDGTGNARQESVEILVKQYPTYDFVIDIVEAERLFFNITEPSANLRRLGYFMPMDADKTHVSAARQPHSGSTPTPTSSQYGGDDNAGDQSLAA